MVRKAVCVLVLSLTGFLSIQSSSMAAGVVDVKDTTHADGPIALQYGAGTVKFRNVRIRPL